MARCYPFPPNLPKRDWGEAPAKPIELQNCLEAGKSKTKKGKRERKEKKEHKLKKRKLNGVGIEDKTERLSCVTGEKEQKCPADFSHADAKKDVERKIENSSSVKHNGKTLRIWFPHTKTEPGIVSGNEPITNVAEKVCAIGIWKNEEVGATGIQRTEKVGATGIHRIEKVGATGIQRTEKVGATGIPRIDKVGATGIHRIEKVGALAKNSVKGVDTNKRLGYPHPFPVKRAKYENVLSNQEGKKEVLERRLTLNNQKAISAKVDASKKLEFPPPLHVQRGKHEDVNPEKKVALDNQKVLPHMVDTDKTGYPPAKHENLPSKHEVIKEVVVNRATLENQKQMPAIVDPGKKVALANQKAMSANFDTNKKTGYPPRPGRNAKHENIPPKQEVRKELVVNRVPLDNQKEVLAMVDASKKLGFQPPFPVKRVKSEGFPPSKSVTIGIQKAKQAMIDANTMLGYPSSPLRTRAKHEQIPPKQERKKQVVEDKVSPHNQKEIPAMVDPSKKLGFPPPQMIEHENNAPKHKVSKEVAEKRVTLDSERPMPATVEKISLESRERRNLEQSTSFQQGRIHTVEVLRRQAEALKTQEIPKMNVMQKLPTLSGKTDERESRKVASLPEIKARNSHVELHDSSSRKHEKALMKMEKKKKKKMKKRAAQYKALVEDWVPPALSPLGGVQDDWLFGSKQKTAERVPPPPIDKALPPPLIYVSCCGIQSLLPRACYLPEVGIYALPYSIPF